MEAWAGKAVAGASSPALSRPQGGPSSIPSAGTPKGGEGNFPGRAQLNRAAPAQQPTARAGTTHPFFATDTLRPWKTKRSAHAHLQLMARLHVTRPPGADRWASGGPMTGQADSPPAHPV